MKVDISELKATAAYAREVSEKKRLADEYATQEQERIEQAAIEQRAVSALGHVEHKLMESAEKGETIAEIIILEYEEYLTGKDVPSTATDRDRLVGAGLIVFDALLEAELTPTVEHWHDGMGQKSHYFIQADFGE